MCGAATAFNQLDETATKNICHDLVTTKSIAVSSAVAPWFASADGVPEQRPDAAEILAPAVQELRAMKLQCSGIN